VNQEIEDRLAQLTQEYEAGAEQLVELRRREVALRETLLRISGAIQVLQELTGAASKNGGPGSKTDPTARDGAEMMSVG
jgi:hypothetical protein